MGITFKSTFSARKHSTEIQKRNKNRLGAAMSLAVINLKGEIAAGKAVGGGAMKDYTPEYKAYKIKKGRKGNVDLTFTGRMLNGMKVTVLDFGDKLLGRIYFLAVERKKAEWNQKLRYFFGLSSANLSMLRKKLNIK